MHKTKGWAIAILLATGVSALGLVAGRGKNSEHERATSASSAEPRSGDFATSSALTTRRQRNLQLGASYTYDISMKRTTEDGEGKAMFVTTIRGTLVLTVVGPSEEGAQVRAVLESPVRTDAPGPGKSARELGTPFFLVMRPNGAIASFGFPRTMPGDARRQLRVLLASLEIVDTGAPLAWEATSEDGSGEYVASYSRAGERVTKTKLRYDRVRTPNGLMSATSMGANVSVRATAAFTIDESGWPREMREEEAVSVTIERIEIANRGTTTARLVSAGQNHAFDGSYAAAAATFDPDGDALAEGALLAEHNADVNLLGDASFASLVADFEGAKDTHAKHLALARMAALFALRPEALTDAKKKLHEGANSETASAIASALGSAGTPEAQRALTDVLDAKAVPVSTRATALMALGFTDKPTRETQAAVLTQMRKADSDLAINASLSMGAIAKHAPDDATSRDAVDEMIANLQAATTPEDKARWLDALGNAGAPRALSAVLAHTSHPNSVVRAAAVGALRFASGDEVVSVLSTATLDPDDGVKGAAISAIAEQNLLPFIPALDRILQGDRDTSYRIAAVRVLGRAIPLAAEVEAILSRTATHDADPKVREAATTALSKPVR